MRRSIAALLLIISIPVTAFAQLEGFSKGPVLEAYGPAAEVPGVTLPDDFSLKLRFDVAQGAEPGVLNRRLETAARVLNMHGKAGVDPDRVDLAIVIHGSATVEMTGDLYQARKGVDNANAPLIAALRQEGVRFIVCGQSAAANKVTGHDLLPGVEMSLSAITAHAQLEKDGYTLNPF